MPRFEYKCVSDLVMGDWAEFSGTWAKVLECATDPTGWTRITLERYLLPETVMHRTVEVPWSPTRPAGLA